MKKQTVHNRNFVGLVLGVLLVGAISVAVYLRLSRDWMVKAKTKLIPEIVQKVDPSITVKEVTNLKEQSGLLVFDLKLDVQGKEQKFTSYMSKDGKYFFTGGIIVSDLDKQPAQESQARKPLTCEEVKKADTSSLTAFVVADCPFGLQMQRVMKVALAENQDLAKHVSVKYIGSIENGKITSMHGDKEATENLRQICVREEEQGLYWPYISCYMKAGNSSSCLSEVGVNQTKLETCMSDSQKGLAYAQKDFDMANKYQVSGSPTLVVNDTVVSEFDFGGRNADALKQLVCCGSKDKPGFCSQTLSKDDIATAYSVEDKGQVSGTSNVNCQTP